jgi:low temperature requirement protein LtrA
VGDAISRDPSDPLPVLPAAALFGGVALFLLAEVAFKVRVVHAVTVHRLAAAGLLLSLIPLALRIPALAALGIVAAVMAGLIAFESIRYAEFRERVRHEEDEAIARLERDGSHRAHG